MAAALANLARLNGRLAAPFARTMVTAPRTPQVADAFAGHAAVRRYEFTETWADDNIPFSAPLITALAKERGRLRYLEVGAYEGRHLAFVTWLLEANLDATVVDPWFDPALNPEAKYHEIEPRFCRNIERLRLPCLEVVKGFSAYELPRLLADGRRFDLVYVDGSHTAWSVLADLCFCAALLDVGGLMIIDDYWHEESEIGGPGVKPAADRFHGAFRDYFEVTALYRQLVLKKTADIPR